MLYPPSSLDGNQVLQHAFDEATQTLRTNATLSIGSGIAVIIDHTNDSIRLGDGTDFITSTTVGADVGLDVNIINSTPISVILDGVSVGGVVNTTMASANTEYSYVLGTTTKKAKLQLRGTGTLKLAYSPGTSGSAYLTIPAGSSHILDNLDFTSPTTLYFQCTAAGRTLEIETWT